MQLQRTRYDKDLVELGIVVGARGRGSNMAAIADACARGEVPARVKVVIAPSEASPALEKARDLGLHTNVVDPDDPVDFMCALEGCDWVCLAGYMRLLPAQVLHRFPDRVLNIHPALLPKYGGKGMYGLRVHQAVLEAGEKESGCTIHLVNERYDEGEIVMQQRCTVYPDDTPEELAERVLELEHSAYPEALKHLIEHGI